MPGIRTSRTAMSVFAGASLLSQAAVADDFAPLKLQVYADEFDEVAFINDDTANMMTSKTAGMRVGNDKHGLHCLVTAVG